MARLFKRVQIILALSGLGMLFLNFSNPKLAKETVSAVKDPLLVKPLARTGADVAKDKRYVKIDGKLFEYNPRNVYMVNGVPTMYTNGGAPKTLEEWGVKAPTTVSEDSPSSGGDRRALHAVADMVQKNPLAVYGPSGIKTVVEGAREAAAAANQANRELGKFER